MCNIGRYKPKIRNFIGVQTWILNMEHIDWSDFEKVELRAGTILEVLEFPEARKPAYKVKVDFGEYGQKMSSAQITAHYTKEELVGKQIVGVVNFPKKQIGKFMSEFLVTGFADEDGNIVLTTLLGKVPDGSKLC
jgi:tRNA-binding protein